MRKTQISIDFETYSECDIRAAGAYAYADHKSTEVLCLAWAVNDEPPRLWLPDQEPPQVLFNLLTRGAELWAWNSFFEMCIWNLVLKWPPVRMNKWNDTAALAAAQAYPRALGNCGEALGLSDDKAKSKRGKLLIQRLCKPYRGKRNQDQVLLRELYDYCLQDIVAEREIRSRLRDLRGFEKEVFTLDQVINWRGVRLDGKSIESAIDIIGQVEQRLNAEVVEITRGAMESTASRAKALSWISEQGYHIDSYDKAAVQDALDDPRCPANVKRFLEIRQALSKASTKKYDAMRAVLGRDGRAHGVLVYHGAATGRWAGRHFQPQNLPRPSVDDVDAVIAALPSRDPDLIPGEPMEALASCLRGMLIASPGCRLIVCDYASIEARVLAWMADHSAALNYFIKGLDIYKATAADMYGIAYDDVDKEQRFLGKVATLALGYQGGVRAFQKMAQAYGADIDDDTALRVRDEWRAANKPIVTLWAEIERAAISAVTWGDEVSTRCGSFKLVGKDLLFKLPSNRILSFPNCRTEIGEYGDNKLTYDGMNNQIHRWGSISMYGGSIVQSITQAVARDLLAAAVARVEKAGYPVVLTVHDEIVADVPKDHGTLEEFTTLMTTLPDWAPGIPVEAEGYESRRYKK
jgi:DNA polymerase